MVLCSCYLVIAPILEDPALEFLYAALFLIAGSLLYFPFVKYKFTFRFMGKLVDSINYTNALLYYNFHRSIKCGIIK